MQVTDVNSVLRRMRGLARTTIVVYMANANILTLEKRGTGVSEIAREEQAIFNAHQQQLAMAKAAAAFSDASGDVKLASLAQAGGLGNPPLLTGFRSSKCGA